MSRYLGLIPEEQFNLGAFMVPFPEGDYEAGVGVAKTFSEATLVYDKFIAPHERVLKMS